eukprot:gene8683-11734_t
MGKDKNPPLAVPTPTTLSKPPKGHRQKGAGTVITAKPAIVTNDGIVLKAHERLPSQLLHEYCQREKRTTPRYFPNPPGLKFTVLLADSKNSRNDMRFSPLQSVDSEAVAKDYAALLALFQFQKSLPLERKLPEPYRTSWLQMLNVDNTSDQNNKKISSSNNVITAESNSNEKTVTDDVSTKAAKSNGINHIYITNKLILNHISSYIGFVWFNNLGKILNNELNSSTTIHLDRNESDWLCDSCGNQNYAKLASGQMRLKCFRCSNPKSDAVTLVGNANKVPTSSASTNYVTVKAPPAPVLDLRSAQKYNSKAEEEKAKMESKVKRQHKNSYFDALRRSNRPMTVYFQSSIIRMIENVLGYMNKSQDSNNPQNGNKQLLFKDFEMQVSTSSSFILIPNEVCKLSSDCQIIQLKSLCNSFINQGFSEHDIISIIIDIQNNPQNNDDLIEQLNDLIIDETSSDMSYNTSLAVEAYNHVIQEIILKKVYNLNDDSNNDYENRNIVNDYSSSFKAMKTNQNSSLISSNIPLALYNNDDTNIKLIKFNNINSNSNKYGWIMDENSYILEENPIYSKYESICYKYCSILNNKSKEYSSLLIFYESYKINEPVESYPIDELVLEEFETIEAIYGDRYHKETHNQMIIIHINLNINPNISNKNNLCNDGTNSYPEIFLYIQFLLHEKSCELKVRQSLPAWKVRSEFLNLMSSNQAMVVTGETGCGKSTQIPQFLHEEYNNAKIVICQPRRLAAIGVGLRVAEEMNEAIGNTVGYMVKGDSKSSKNTRIVFCTYGVLLRRLQVDPTLAAIDYVILDEVHERGMDSDFTLALLISTLKQRESLKLILMSATISTEHFSSYLAKSLQTPALVPIMFIPGFTFPVTEYFKNDYEKIIRNYDNNINNNFNNNDRDYNDWDDENSNNNNMKSSSYLIGGKRRKGDIDYDLLIRLILFIISNKSQDNHDNIYDNKNQLSSILSPPTGSILVFMPGIGEISRAINLLQAHHNLYPNNKKLKLLPLHGNLSPSEQKKIFQPVQNENEIKIVISTNVAEASITIPDVTVVIDTCRVKEMNFDAETQSSMLMMKLAAHDSLTQRKGRAGRNQSGQCYRLITRLVYDKLPSNGTPEMLRIPLDSIVLQIKAMSSVIHDGHNNNNNNDKQQHQYDCRQILQQCIDPPSLDAINQSVRNLQIIRALDDNYDLAPLGSHLAQLPCAPRIGKLVIYGCLLGCLYPASSVAACLINRTPFISSNEPEIQEKIKRAKDIFSNGSSLKSDYFIIINMLRSYDISTNQRSFCREYGLSYERIQEIKQTQFDLLEGLVELGFLSSVKDGQLNHNINYEDNNNNNNQYNRNSHKPRIILSTLCAGLYPSISKIMKPPKRFVEVFGSNLERDSEAHEMKFYIQDQLLDDAGMTTDATAASVAKANEYEKQNIDISTTNMTRVFLHPSSINFNNSSFKYIYLRDTTEITASALLFFGGKLDCLHDSDGIVTVDKWMRFSAPNRVISLIKDIRHQFDILLQQKIENIELDISWSPVLEAVCMLLDADGLMP